MYLARGKQIHHVLLITTANPVRVEVNAGRLRVKLFGDQMTFRVSVFLGRDIENLLARVHELLGPAQLPPFWAMGIHQSRWGYQSAQALLEARDGFWANGIPL
jgi:alpha-glucosidase (family GH31 glycosyl hydrolase)